MRNELTHKQKDFEYLDMFDLTPEEFARIMTPEDLREMEEYFKSKEKKKTFGNNAQDNPTRYP